MLVAYCCFYVSPSILCRVTNVNMVTRPDMLLKVHMSADRKDDSENTVRCWRQIKRSPNVPLFPVACQWNEEFLMVWYDHLWSKSLAIFNRLGSFFKCQAICQKARCLAGKVNAAKLLLPPVLWGFHEETHLLELPAMLAAPETFCQLNLLIALAREKVTCGCACVCTGMRLEVQQSLAGRHGKIVAGWKRVLRCHFTWCLPRRWCRSSHGSRCSKTHRPSLCSGCPFLSQTWAQKGLRKGSERALSASIWRQHAKSKCTGPKIHSVTCYTGCTCPEYPEDTDSFGRGLRLQYFEWVMLNARSCYRVVFFSVLLLPLQRERAVIWWGSKNRLCQPSAINLWGRTRVSAEAL